MRTPPFCAIVAALVSLVGSGPLWADTITQDISHTNFNDSWETGNTWSNELPASGVHDYVSGPGMVIRSPVGTNETFPGLSLTINQAQFNLTGVTGPGATPGVVLVGNLTATGGAAIVNANGSSLTQTLEGALSISGSAFFRLNASNTVSRSIALNSTLTGSGNIGLIQKGTLTLGGTGNTFGGMWTIGGTAMVLNPALLANTYTNTSDRISTLMASSAQSLGLGSSVTVDAFGIFRTGYNWETSGALILSTNSLTELDFDWTVGSLTINGDVLDPGTYSYDYLFENYSAFFSDTVTGGSITVVPEPGVYGLLLGSLGLLGLRRRQRS